MGGVPGAVLVLVPVWTSMGASMDQYGPVWGGAWSCTGAGTSMDQYGGGYRELYWFLLELGPVRTSIDQYGPVWWSPGAVLVPVPVWTSIDQYGPVWTSMGGCW